jgi:Amidohydrolase
MTTATPHSANRLGLNYEAEAERLGRPEFPIVDVHTHLNGREAVRLYQHAAQLYGVGLTYSMTPPEGMDDVRAVLGDAVRFIAIPDYHNLKSFDDLGEKYARQIERLHGEGVRIAKFWSAPRGRDLEEKLGLPGALRLDASHIVESMSCAAELGMVIMVHIGDPDTWFASKYTDVRRYGSKRDQYDPLEAALERFNTPFIAAHMGGWPEDLDFLSDMLSRHPNLRLDTSATKWMVRELSKHPRKELVAFFERWSGRILFGSDIVTSDEHLSDQAVASQSLSAIRPSEVAFDLYASRYWALRTLLETNYVGESPIADPDLEMLDSERYDSMSAPALEGKSLPPSLLRTLMHDAARNLPEETGG